jgi:hypothetical protein
MPPRVDLRSWSVNRLARVRHRAIGLNAQWVLATGRDQKTYARDIDKLEKEIRRRRLSADYCDAERIVARLRCDMTEEQLAVVAAGMEEDKTGTRAQRGPGWPTEYVVELVCDQHEGDHGDSEDARSGRARAFIDETLDAHRRKRHRRPSRP